MLFSSPPGWDRDVSRAKDMEEERFMTTLYKPPQKKPNVEIQLLWVALTVFLALAIVMLTIHFFPAGKEWAHSEFVRMILEKFSSRQWSGIR
jgi:hypothetical protein